MQIQLTLSDYATKLISIVVLQKNLAKEVEVTGIEPRPITSKNCSYNHLTSMITLNWIAIEREIKLSPVLNQYRISKACYLVSSRAAVNILICFY